MSKRLFISGIGTDVGKTLVSAILTEALQADYWKPVQSGNEQSEDARTVASLISNTRTRIHPEAYSFKAPLSPHFAAELEGAEIDLAKIVLPSTGNHLLIEGAGGLLVPLNRTHYAIDLAKALDAAVVLVVRNYLGCINHSLLSMAYLKHQGYHVAGLVLNGEFEPQVRAAITADASFPVLAAIPDLPVVSKETVKQVAASLQLNLTL